MKGAGGGVASAPPALAFALHMKQINREISNRPVRVCFTLVHLTICRQALT